MWLSHDSNLIDITNTFVTFTFIFLLYIYRKPFLTIAIACSLKPDNLTQPNDPTGRDPTRPDRTQWPNPTTQPDWTWLDLTGPDNPARPNPTKWPSLTQWAWYCEPVKGWKSEWETVVQNNQTGLDPTGPDRTQRPDPSDPPDPTTRPKPTSMVLWTCRRMKRVSEKQLFRIIHSLTLVVFALAILVVTLATHDTRWTCWVQESKLECVRKSQHCRSCHFQHCHLARAQ
jgi:hypothetical protein